MRINANPAVLPVWRDDESLVRIVSADSLAVARVEPVFTRRTEGNLALDLIFVREGQIAVIPAIRVAHEMLLEPECSPLIWPRCAQAVDEQKATAIERLVIPWLLSHAVTGNINAEIVRRFSEGLDVRDFDRARNAGFAGAATYRETAKAAAPYVYAQRFAERARVGIADANGAAGAALLTRFADDVSCDLGDAALNLLAARWFGLPIFKGLEGEFDLGIGTRGAHTEIRFDGSGDRVVAVATPVPSEFLVSFDTGNAPACRSFSVTCKRRMPLRKLAPIAQTEAVGGSAGRILLLVASATAHLGALGDEVEELGRRLGAEGFDAEICSANAGIDVASYDLVHAFDLAGNPDFGPLLQRARSRCIPVIATAGTADAGVELSWAAPVIDALMRTVQDDSGLKHHFEMMALRRLNTDPSISPGGEPDARYLTAAGSAFAAVDMLLVSSERDLESIRRRFGYAGPAQTVVAYVNADNDVSPIDELCGTREFVFAHTPIAPAFNLLMLSRAAQALNLPLVIGGPVADALHYAYLHEALDGRTVILPDPRPEEVNALYRRARVFADVAWRQPSVHRAARAILSGCSILVSDRTPAAALWPDGVVRVDPANAGAMESALQLAWDAVPAHLFGADVARQCDPAASFLATVQAYAQAQSAGMPA